MQMEAPCREAGAMQMWMHHAGRRGVQRGCDFKIQQLSDLVPQFRHITHGVRMPCSVVLLFGLPSHPCPSRV